MIGSARRPRRLALAAGALLALAAVLAVAGCGGGGEDSTAAKTPGVVVAGSDGSDPAASVPGSSSAPSSQAGGNGSSDGGEDGGAASAGAGQPGNGGSPTRSGGGGDGKGQGQGQDGTETQAPNGGIKRVAAKHCPQGVELNQCKALATDAEQAPSAPTYPAAVPEDCLKVMSREACEALYTAQKQAAEANGASVDVQACLQNPTPECERIVRPLVEQQRAAEEAAK